MGSVFALAGCAQRTETDAGVVVGYSILFLLLCLAIGAIGIPVGYKLTKQFPKIGWVLLVTGILVLVLGVPSYFLEKFEITKDGVSQRTSAFGTRKASFRFEEVQSVHVEKVLRRPPRGMEYMEFIVTVAKKDGSQLKLIMDDDVSRAAADDLWNELRKRNIPLTIVDR